MVGDSLDEPCLPRPLKSPRNQRGCEGQHYEIDEEFEANYSPLLKIDRDRLRVGETGPRLAQ